MTRVRRPLHTHQAPAPAEDEDAATRAAVVGELGELIQVSTELAGERYTELLAAGEPEAATAASQMAHDIAERLHERARQWQPET